jgi:hypothetical protein
MVGPLFKKFPRKIQDEEKRPFLDLKSVNASLSSIRAEKVALNF